MHCNNTLQTTLFLSRATDPVLAAVSVDSMTVSFPFTKDHLNSVLKTGKLPCNCCILGTVVFDQKLQAILPPL